MRDNNDKDKDKDNKNDKDITEQINIDKKETEEKLLKKRIEELRRRDPFIYR